MVVENSTFRTYSVEKKKDKTKAPHALSILPVLLSALKYHGSHKQTKRGISKHIKTIIVSSMHETSSFCILNTSCAGKEKGKCLRTTLLWSEVLNYRVIALFTI